MFKSRQSLGSNWGPCRRKATASTTPAKVYYWMRFFNYNVQGLYQHYVKPLLNKKRTARTNGTNKRSRLV